ncbi:MAG TPA: hypothetical protein VEI57_07440 [Nitrospirota bacterium]|nr:hypothetical protein [Nitrospirota bacterium]
MKIVVMFFCFMWCINLAYADMPYDYPNQPKGFRNISWGENLATIKGMKKMDVFDEDSDIVTYAREQDALQIGAAKLDFIHYIAWRNKFSGVIISFKGSSNYEGLKETLVEKFGTGKKDDYNDNLGWYGVDTTIILEYNAETRRGSLMFKSNKIRVEEEAYRKEKAKEGAAKGF